MAIGLIGQKCGMSHIFNSSGCFIPVTIIWIEPNIIVQIKTKDKDGYNALQITKGSKKRSRINKPLSGHFLKSNLKPGEKLWEFRLENINKEYKVGYAFKVDFFAVGQKVNVTGISKGKGFSGVIKRHNFHSQDSSHGNSLSHRAPGSIGQNQTPGRVFKGKKMAGHLGNVQKTISSLEIMQIDSLKNLIFIKGSVPGTRNRNVIIKPEYLRGV